MIAALIHAAVCLLGLSRCAEFASTPRGLRCVRILPRTTCPATLTFAGWHPLLGGVTCDRGCPDDD